jgi:hypothetical protein
MSIEFVVVVFVDVLCIKLQLYFFFFFFFFFFFLSVNKILLGVDDKNALKTTKQG